MLTQLNIGDFCFYHRADSNYPELTNLFTQIIDVGDNQVKIHTRNGDTWVAKSGITLIPYDPRFPLYDVTGVVPMASDLG